MTDLTRLFRHLVQTLSATDSGRLRQPIPLADIRSAIVPYRTHRRALQIDSSEDYELALIQLCAGYEGLASVNPEEARVRFEEEAGSSNPELGLVRQFPDALVTLVPAQVAAALSVLATPADTPDTLVDRVFSAPPFEHQEAAATEPESEVEPEPELQPEPELAPQTSIPSFHIEDIASPIGDVALPGAVQCVACAEMLPADRVVKFCPYCGKHQAPPQCTGCGADLEAGWRFCVACGQPT